MSLFIANATQTAGAPAGGSGIELLIMLAVFGLILLVISPAS